MDYPTAAKWCYFVLGRRNPVLPPIRRAATAVRHLEAIRACSLVDQSFIESPAAKLWAAGEILDESSRVSPLTGLRFAREGAVERYTAKKLAEFIFFSDWFPDRRKIDAWVYMYRPIFDAATRPVNEEDMRRALGLMYLIPDHRACKLARFVAECEVDRQDLELMRTALSRGETVECKVEQRENELVVKRDTVGPIPLPLHQWSSRFSYSLEDETDGR